MEGVGLRCAVKYRLLTLPRSLELAACPLPLPSGVSIGLDDICCMQLAAAAMMLGQGERALRLVVSVARAWRSRVRDLAYETGHSEKF